MLAKLKLLAKKKKIPLYTTLDKYQLEDALSKKKFSLGWRLKYIKPIVSESAEYKNVMYKLLDPIRDVDNNKKVTNFLKKHKVYITMTTSPKRLSRVGGGWCIGNTRFNKCCKNLYCFTISLWQK